MIWQNHLNVDVTDEDENDKNKITSVWPYLSSSTAYPSEMRSERRSGRQELPPPQPTSMLLSLSPGSDLQGGPAAKARPAAAGGPQLAQAAGGTAQPPPPAQAPGGTAQHPPGQPREDAPIKENWKDILPTIRASLAKKLVWPRREHKLSEESHGSRFLYSILRG